MELFCLFIHNGTKTSYTCFKYMMRNEVYTALVLITIILISITWKEEMVYRRSLFRAEKLNDLKIPLDKEHIKDIGPHKIIPDTTSKGFLGKKKPSNSPRPS